MVNHIGFRRAPLASALAIVLGTSGGVAAQGTGGQAQLEEVLVTARKRSESVMDIPASVQALTESDLKELGVKGVSDLSRFVPSLNSVDFGSGITDVVFRGATSDPGYVVQSTSSVYFDEVSITTQGQQPYIRMVDISRIEALAGPQGSLYGSDSQAGTLRIISNKPDVNNWEVTVDGSARDGQEGESSWDGSLVVNLPIIEDSLALRVVAYGASDGGFIDNVPGTTITNDRKTDAAYGRSPSGWGSLDNSDVVDDNINDFDVSGVRASLLWNVNEDWSFNLSHMHQETEAGSYNAFDENVGDLETVIFNKEYYDVELDITSLTIEGDLGFAQLVSATSYYDSESSFTQDITNYQKSYSAYYCISYDADPSYFPYYYAPPEGGVLFAAAGQYCNAPTVEGDFLSAFDEDQNSDRFAQEFRLSATGETVDWLVGVFYEESNYTYEEFFGYPTANAAGRGDPTELYQQTISADWFEFDSGQATPPQAYAPFYALSSSDSEQVAVFGEVVWHATDKIDVTLGARWFDRKNQTDYLQRQPAGQAGAETQKLKADDSEIAPKLALSYDLSDDSMVYALYSVGYRPGGTNRQRGAPALPQQFEPDEMTNYEIGYRGSLSDGAMRFAATGFYMDWADFQFELTDPAQTPCPDGGSIDGVCGQPFQVGVTNAGDASILGVNVEFDWAVTDNLLVGLNAQWLDAQTDSDIDVSGDGEVNIAEGSQLPNTPDWTGAAWASYNFPVPIAAANGYVRLQWSYSGERLSNLEPSTSETYPQFEMAAYDIGDLTVGLQGDTWELSLFVNNVTDERAIFGHSRQGGGTQENTNDGRFEVNQVYTNRPREYGIRVVKRWGGS
ncbi:MAG: iron complex outermembrane receptor protein [Halioglobus sp.]|jgi:iron complex outermembrane receptor protein